MTRPALVVLLLLAASPLCAEGILLPPGFDGLYAPEGMACTGFSAISVEAGVMTGSEFAITVTDLVEFPGEPNRVEATMLNEGGGGDWEDSAILTLSADGTTLRFDYPDGTSVVWSRCP